MSWSRSFGNDYDCPHNCPPQNCPLDENSEEGKYQYVTHSSELTTPNVMDVMGLTIIGDFGGHLGLKGRKRRISWSPKVNCNCELYTNRCDLFHSIPFHSILHYSEKSFWTLFWQAILARNDNSRQGQNINVQLWDKLWIWSQNKAPFVESPQSTIWIIETDENVDLWTWIRDQ